MNNYMELLILYSTAWALFSLITFGFYAYDKRQAIKGKFRVNETTLLVLTFMLGSIGALAGLYLLKHKTKHIMFVVVTWVSFIIHSGILVWLVYQI